MAKILQVKSLYDLKKGQVTMGVYNSETGKYESKQYRYNWADFAGVKMRGSATGAANAFEGADAQTVIGTRGMISVASQFESNKAKGNPHAKLNELRARLEMWQSGNFTAERVPTGPRWTERDAQALLAILADKGHDAEIADVRATIDGWTPEVKAKRLEAIRASEQYAALKPTDTGKELDLDALFGS